MINDLRSLVRRLLATPGFTAAAVLTLALGVGANTAIFAVLHSVVLQPLPYDQPDRLVALEQRMTRGAVESPFPWSYPRFDELRGLTRSFEAVAAFRSRPVNVTGENQPERLLHEVVTAGYFDVLGVRARLGRTFTAAEDDPARPQAVAVISDGLWRRRFGGDPGIIGRTIQLDDRAYTVIGVLPPDFQPMGNGTELWTPMAMAPVLYGMPQRLTMADAGWLNAMARLRQGVTLEAAAAELAAVHPALERAWPSPAQTPIRPVLRPLLDARIDPAIRTSAWILFAAVSLVLLIACANYATLLLARASSRRRELAIRRALGASRGALVRTTLLEAFLLAAAGGLVGLILAAWGTDLLTSLRPEGLRGFWSAYARAIDPASVRMSGVVIAFGFGVSLLTGLAFALLPALHAARIDSGEVLQARASEGGTIRGVTPRRILIVAQMALAVVLVTGAALVVNSFSRLLATSIGARSEQLLTFRIDLPRTRYDGERIPTFHDQLLANLESLPGVRSAAIANALPVSGQTQMTVAAPAPEEVRDPIGVNIVSAHWFDTFDVPLLEGRLPAAAERAAAAHVAVLNATAARHFFRDRPAVGSRLRLALGILEEVEVVGVVGDVRYESVDELAGPNVYLGSGLYPVASAYVTLGTEGEPLALLGPARSVVRSLDSQLPLYDVRTMRERVDAALSRNRFSAVLLGTFALLALVLAAIGVYGVVSYDVRARTREIAIRMAVGAPADSVLRAVLLDGLRKACSALLIGVPAALAATRLLRSLLYGVAPHDPLTLAGVATTIVAVSLLAAWLPARRAARTDPMQVLRHD